MHQSILRLFENINIKHYNIIKSRKTNLRLIENIAIQAPTDTMSIRKGIFFHVSRFLEKMIFQLMFEKLLCEFANFRSVGKLFQTIRYDKSISPEHVFFKGCFCFKAEDLVFA